METKETLTSFNKVVPLLSYLTVQALSDMYEVGNRQSSYTNK